MEKEKKIPEEKVIIVILEAAPLKIATIGKEVVLLNGTDHKTYITKKPVKYQEKQHPFGGMLKINMRNWALGDCQ